MAKIFNEISFIFGAIGGVAAYFLGGFDNLLKAIIILIVLDYITGVIKAIYLKQISSEVGFKGILKKITICIVIAFAYVIQGITNNTVPLREIVIMFFIANEGISLLENAAVLIPIPEKLKDVLLQLRDKTGVEKVKEEIKQTVNQDVQQDNESKNEGNES